jgi:hypothetical protein
MVPVYPVLTVIEATDTLVSMVQDPSFELPKVTVSAACGVVKPHDVQLPDALQLAVELAFQVQLLASAARVDATLARTPRARVTQRRQHRCQRPRPRIAFDREEGEAIATSFSATGDALPLEESTPNRPSRSRCELATVLSLPAVSGGFVVIRAL